MRPGFMSISEAARRTALSVDTLRYYERRRLLPPPARTAARYRAYSGGDLERLRFIARAKAMGFSLREIPALAPSDPGTQPECATVRDLLRAKLAAVRQRQRDLNALEAELRRHLRQCDRALGHAAARLDRRCPALEPKS
ncbi:MAG: MerR family transcriptional regulator [Terriglobales bacterium]